MLSPGSRLGPYEIRGLLGSGGMGEVYRAYDARLRRDVAIKVLPQFLTADRERVSRFEREVHLLAALNHPNIAAIHSIDEYDGVPALILELVEGETPSERLARGPLPLAEALMNARQVADALRAAHEKGIVHHGPIFRAASTKRRRSFPQTASGLPTPRSSRARTKCMCRAFRPPAANIRCRSTAACSRAGARDGSELFFLDRYGKMTVVPVKTDGGFEAGSPATLFQTKILPHGSQSIYFFTAYDVSPDGQRFFINGPADDPGPPITVVFKWTAARK